MTDLTPGPAPAPVTLEGRYCRLEPLAAHHAETLYAAIAGPDLVARYRYMTDAPPADAAEHWRWVAAAVADRVNLHFALIDRETGRCGGRQALLRIRPEHRSVEIGNVLWGRGVARTRIATEALFLTARHVFEDLGYRRFEWKCNDLNAPSKRAAIRFGFRFEGVFRQDMIVRGANRDTAWFSMLDGEWPVLKRTYETWLAPENFDADGEAKTRLGTRR